jgi:hypothetical protein
MKAALKPTPLDEILRVSLRETERRLRDTDMLIESIADQTVFVHSH